MNRLRGDERGDVDEPTGTAVSAEEAEAARVLLYRYARAVDEQDEKALHALVTDDVVLHRVDGAREGRAAFLDFYRSVFDGPVEWSKHLVTNVVVVREGIGLRASAYFEAVSVADGTGRAIYGEYHDRFVGAGGQLRISEKRIDVQHTFLLGGRDA